MILWCEQKEKRKLFICTPKYLVKRILKIIKPYKNNNKFKFKNNKNICLVYSIWSNIDYVNSCFYSILSQIKNSDVLDYSIIVYVDQSIEEYSRKTLNNLIPQQNIISINLQEISKQKVAVRDELKYFKKIALLDCDTFLKCKNKKNVYSTLSKQDSIIFANRIQRAKVTIKERTNWINHNLREDYLGLLKPLIEKKENNWFTTQVSIYPTKIIEEFKKVVDKFKKYNLWCDETAWMLFTLNKSPLTLDQVGAKFVDSNALKSINLNTNKIFFAHPFADYTEKLYFENSYYLKILKNLGIQYNKEIFDKIHKHFMLKNKKIF